MSKLILNNTYAKLLQSIKSEIAAGRAAIQKTQAQTYWKVGKFINDYVLEGADRAKYGEHIYDHLSKDLKIDKRTLERTTQFAREFPIAAARPQLTWSQFRTLLSLPDPSARARLIHQTMTKRLTTRQLQAKVDRQKVLHIPSEGPIPQLKFTRGPLYTYQVIEPPSLQPVEGDKFVDCGFNIWRQVPPVQLAKFKNADVVESVKTPQGYKIKSSDRGAKDLYVFKATIERIVDGDTVLVQVDCGFETWTRQYLRFRAIDCPELSTAAGQNVKRFIESRIKPNDFVIIKTHKDDKYGRYLVDVWYAPAPVIAGSVRQRRIRLGRKATKQSQG